MAGTREGAIKAWDKRGRKQHDADLRQQVVERLERAHQGGGSNPLASRGDWMGSGADSANPPFILGALHPTAQINEYLAKNGAKMKTGSKRPPNVPKMADRECYTNATRLVMMEPDRYDYAEGFAYPEGALGGIAVLHAWAVDKKTGDIVDPTWANPQKCRYYGVVYDRAKLYRHMQRTKMYGVLGGHPEAGQSVLERGKL